MTQCERIIDYINEFGSITDTEARNDLGVHRLSARISELKKAGFMFDIKMESAKNRYGETTHFARYSKSKNGLRRLKNE